MSLDASVSYGLPDELITADHDGVYASARFNFILASGEAPVIGKLGIGGMECPHMPGTYYLIARKTSYASYNQ